MRDVVGGIVVGGVVVGGVVVDEFTRIVVVVDGIIKKVVFDGVIKEVVFDGVVKKVVVNGVVQKVVVEKYEAIVKVMEHRLYCRPLVGERGSSFSIWFRFRFLLPNKHIFIP